MHYLKLPIFGKTCPILSEEIKRIRLLLLEDHRNQNGGGCVAYSAYLGAERIYYI